MEQRVKDFPLKKFRGDANTLLQMSRNVRYLERFEYMCRDCGQKGTVLDVLLNPDVLLIRGYCDACKKRGTYKVIDIEALRQEHEAMALEHEQSEKRVAWKWELMQEKPKKPKA